MALKITPDGILSIEYDASLKKWRSHLRPPMLKDLMRAAELPGLTLSNLFDVVSRNTKLVELLSEMCYVDVAALQERLRYTGEPLLRSDFVKVIALPDTPATSLVVERFVRPGGEFVSAIGEASEDRKQLESQGPRSTWLQYGLAVDGEGWPSPLPVAWSLEPRWPVPESMQCLLPFVELLDLEYYFKGIVNLPLRLRSVIVSEERRTEQPQPFKFFEILTAIYGAFAKLPYYFDEQQKDILESEMNMEWMKRIFGDGVADNGFHDEEGGAAG